MKNLLTNFGNGKTQLILIWVVARVFIAIVPGFEIYLDPLREIGLGILGVMGFHSFERGLSKPTRNELVAETAKNMTRDTLELKAKVE